MYTPRQLLETVVRVAEQQAQHNVSMQGKEAMSRAILNIVCGKLQLLEVDHALSDEARKLLTLLEGTIKTINEHESTRPAHVSSSLMQWESAKETTLNVWSEIMT